MLNLFGDSVPVTPEHIIESAAGEFGIEAPKRILLSFSGGNDSRTLAHIAAPICRGMEIDLELAAIRTGLGMDCWEESIREYAEWIGLPVRFWDGDGRGFYKEFVESYGFPGNPQHGRVQQRLKGRAYRVMRREYGIPLVVLSGIRKFESRRRRLLQSPYSRREGVCFVSPLFYWENHQVVDYMYQHGVPLSPGTQYDCKCGATAKVPKAEWADIQREGGDLYKFLSGLQTPAGCRWAWGSFPRGGPGGQVERLFDMVDGGTIEEYPVCVHCWRDADAEDERLMREW